MTPTDRRRAAVHEAAHAVLATLLKQRVREIRLTPEHPSRRGECRYVPRKRASYYQFEDAYHTALIQAAGTAAEERLTGARSLHGGSDVERMQTTLRDVCESHQEADELLTTAYTHACQLVARPRVRRAIECVARALEQFGSLDGMCVVQLVRAAVER